MEVEVKSREDKYRGKTLSQLKSMDVREAAKYLPSRSRRSVLRNFNIIEKFMKNCDKKEKKNKKIKTHLRDLVIVPHLVGKKISVYNGTVFNEIEIYPEMIGHRLGEFSFTRKKVTHSAAGIGATKSSRAMKK